MRSRKMFWRLYPPYLAVTVLSLLILAVYAAYSLRGFYLERTGEALEIRGRLIERQVKDFIAAGEMGSLDSLCKHFGRIGAARITVILPSGRVVGDSDEYPAGMNDHADRPEVIAALDGGSGTALRYSHTVGQEMMYLALPLEQDGRTVGVLRAAMPVTAVNEVLRGLYWKVALGALVVLAVMFAVNLWNFRRISRPLEQLRNGAEMFARGEFDRRLVSSGIRELDDLADSLNRMASMLNERITEITSQRNELESLLSGMLEGVIVTDREQRILRLNRAAGKLFGATPEQARGRILHEVIRNSDLQRFIASLPESDSPAEGEVEIHIGETRYLQAHGTFLPINGDFNILIVLNDVTRIRRLENIRRDFVANVSHELKTPITSIKGFVETLLGGAMKTAELERFLRIILKHADRLNSIIEDILDLSRIEQESEKSEVALELIRLRPVIGSAIQACRLKAESKALEISLDCPDDLQAWANSHLLELALVNLLDNAIKYSDSGSRVEIEVSLSDNGPEIRVRDYGPGIEKKHLDRLFERFYRVDKARSRHLGGTGLGLSIVKHICQVHNGRVSVRSEPGTGSTFTIHLPRA